MPAGLAEIRERLHRKSHEYFVFDRTRLDRKKWHMFYGAMDALLDAGQAAASYGRAFRSDTGIDLLMCYGFLQALYIQQHAVRTLSRTVGLGWHPNDDKRLKQIRDARNRLTGHPSLAGEREKPPLLSSAIIPHHDITRDGFRGHVYYSDGAEDIRVEVSSFLKDNEEHLASQMRLIEKTMDEKEHKFRTEQACRPLSTCFEGTFSYLVQRLHCDLSGESRVVQAQTHASMIRETLKTLEQGLIEREFGSAEISLDIQRLFTGLDLLESILNDGSASLHAQHKFDLIYDGIEKNINLLKKTVSDIDARLRAPI